MALTPAQQQTLKAYIEADGTLNAFPQNSDGAFEIARLLNLDASPDYVVYKQEVMTDEIGKAVNYVAVEATTTANKDSITLFYRMNPLTCNPSRTDVRAFFDDVFSGALGGEGQNTRDALQALWRRLATRFESIYAVGAGTDVSPSTLVVVGSVSYPEVQQARNLP